MKEKLWDDKAFKRRLAAVAKRKGTTVPKALVAAGSSRYYLTKAIDGRSTNTILNLARVLDVPAAELFGVDGGGADAPADATSGGLNIADMPDSDRLRRVTVVARMIAAQLAALVYVACSKSDADPAALMESVMREISRDQTTEESGGKSQ